MDIGDIIEYFISLILQIIPLLVTVAVLVFFWGIVVFITNAGDEKKIEEGKTLILWGLVGLFVIVSLWGIVGYIQETLGLSFSSPLGNLSEFSGTIPS